MESRWDSSSPPKDVGNDKPSKAGLLSNQTIATKEKFACANSPLLFSSPRSNSSPEPEHFGQPISFMPREDWPAWDRVKKAYFTLFVPRGAQFRRSRKSRGHGWGNGFQPHRQCGHSPEKAQAQGQDGAVAGGVVADGGSGGSCARDTRKSFRNSAHSHCARACRAGPSRPGQCCAGVGFHFGAVGARTGCEAEALGLVSEPRGDGVSAKV